MKLVNPKMIPEIDRFATEKLGICETELMKRSAEAVKSAIEKVQNGAVCVELEPQDTAIRKLQHELVEQYGLQSTSVGEGECRHLRISR
jgi:predicted RNA-binding protein Jag